MTFEPVADTDIQRPTHAEIDLDQLSANYRAIDEAVGGATVMPVLKANAYGHGLVAVAQHLEPLGPAGFGVAFLEEAVLLRTHGITSPILVMGGLDNAQIPHFLKHDLTLTASSGFKLEEIDRVARELGTTARVHLKIDTGMGRIGMRPDTAVGMFEMAAAARHVDVAGIYSHFATADEADRAGTDQQLTRFLEAVEHYPGDTPPLHIANSGGILQHPDSHLDMVRPGILLFGVYPSDEVDRTIAVAPALTWKSQVAYFKVQPAGEPVSYGSTWAPTADTRIVTVPAGYGDGYFRALSNRGEVLINGTRHPIVGRVCMDQFMVDIGHDGTAYNGDEVVLLGGRGTDAITVEDLADWAGTIPYEVLTNINTRVTRVYRRQTSDGTTS